MVINVAQQSVNFPINIIRKNSTDFLKETENTSE